MADNNNSNADKWQHERNDVQGNPWDSINIKHVPRFFPDSVYEQASTEASLTLPTLDPTSIPQVSTMRGMFENNGHFRPAWSPSSTLAQSSIPTLAQSTSPSYSEPRPSSSQPPITTTSNHHDMQAHQVTQPRVGIAQGLYPNNPESRPPFSNIKHNPQSGREESHNPGPHHNSDPSPPFNGHVPTPPSPPFTPYSTGIDPWDCLDLLKIVAFQCSPNESGPNAPIPHKNRILHGTPRYCLNPLDFSDQHQTGLQQLLEFGARILAARRKVKALFVDKNITIPMVLEDFIQDLGESAGAGRNGVPLQEAVEDLEGYLRSMVLAKRPQVLSSGQILDATIRLCTRAMTEADAAFEIAKCENFGRDEINRAWRLYINYQEIIGFVESIKAKVMYMYEKENEGPFLVTDFENVESLILHLDRSKLLDRQKKYDLPRWEKLREDDMGKLLKRFKVLGKGVMRILRERGVGEEEYSVEHYLDEWLSE